MERLPLSPLPVIALGRRELLTRGHAPLQRQFAYTDSIWGQYKTPLPQLGTSLKNHPSSRTFQEIESSMAIYCKFDFSCKRNSV